MIFSAVNRFRLISASFIHGPDYPRKLSQNLDQFLGGRSIHLEENLSWPRLWQVPLYGFQRLVISFEEPCFHEEMLLYYCCFISILL
jgi:hypothetical protein